MSTVIHRALVALTGALTFFAFPAQACIPFGYVDTTATGLVRTESGIQRNVSIEVSGELVRLEYQSSASPTGRVAIVGSVDSTEVVWFPIASGAKRSNASARKTSWESVNNALGLPPPRMFWGRYAAGWAPVQKFKKFDCQPAIGGWGYDGTYDKTVCVKARRTNVTLQELPIYVVGRTGLVRFEIQALHNRPISRDRFVLPGVATLMSPGGCGG